VWVAPAPGPVESSLPPPVVVQRFAHLSLADLLGKLCATKT
jgi:hypothetical protein